VVVKTQRNYWQEAHDQVMEEMQMIKYRGPGGPWQAEFAWRPVQDIHGQWHWLRRIYKREKNRILWPHQGYEYGNAFDVLKDA
jgi:hypothetical protein